VLFVS